MPLILDASQLRAWLKCPLYWYEKYVRGVAPEYPERLRDDPLALGSLTHSGLESFYRSSQNSWVISQNTILDVTPTPDCLNLANQLVGTYVREYAQQIPFTINLIEKALTTKIYDAPNIWLAAKLDTAFQVDEVTQVTGGHESECTLTPGVWALEHKTKGAKIDRGLFMRSWQMDPQASFQMLTMREHFEGVRGVLVDVLEKPDIQKPKRKCPKCGGTFEFDSWKHIEGEVFACPFCGETKKQKPYVPKNPPVVKCFRFPIVPSEEKLVSDLALAQKIGREMVEAIRTESCGYDPTECVTPFLNRQCEYFEGHANFVDVKSLSGFTVDPNPLKYIGLEVTRHDLQGR